MRPEDFDENGRFQVGRVLQAKNATYEAQRTEPPTRYTQSDLIDAMMSAHKFASNERDRALLRETAGLGTSRTRESIITGLVERGFLVEQKAKRSRARVELIPSEAARTIISNLPAMLTDPATTAKWELAFQMLESGKAQTTDIERYFQTMLDEIVRQAKDAGSVPIQVRSPGASGKNHFSKTSAAGGGR